MCIGTLFFWEHVCMCERARVYVLEYTADNNAYFQLWAGTGMGAAAVFERGDGVDELSNVRKVDVNNLLSKDAR